MALESAFEPSMMNRRGTAGSSPRSIKLSISAWTTAECSVAPSMSPSGCFVPSLSIPIAATSTISSAIWMPSICTTMMSRWPRSDAIHSFMRAADNATKRREVADFDTPAPRGAGTSPSGSRTARRNFRVDTLINIRFIAHRPSQSSSLARSQLGSGNSWPSKSRTRGRSSSTLPPWKPILPRVRPQRYPRRPSPRAWRGPQTSSASFSSMALTVSRPAARQKRSKLADTSSKALPTSPLGTALVVVLNLFMALLSFRGISTRAYRLKASNAAPSSRHRWDAAFHYGSLVATLAQGFVLGAFVQGFRVEGRFFVGGSFDWLTPFSALTALSLVMGYGLLGATWLIMKTEGMLQDWARRQARWLLVGVVLAMGVVSL